VFWKIGINISLWKEERFASLMSIPENFVTGAITYIVHRLVLKSHESSHDCFRRKRLSHDLEKPIRGRHGYLFVLGVEAYGLATTEMSLIVILEILAEYPGSAPPRSPAIIRGGLGPSVVSYFIYLDLRWLF